MAELSKTTRRGFLTGQAAAQAVGDALVGSPSPLPAPASAVGVQPGSHLLSVSREAMACLFEIVFDAALYRDRTDAAVAALDVVETLEAQLTVYRDTSEVVEMNRHASSGPVVVERGLYELLKRAVALSQATGGAFDITAGRLSKVWGFYRRQGKMPAAEEVAVALATVGSQNLELDDVECTVRFLQPDLELNLGAIGKGYAIDRAATALEQASILDFLIHGGNSSVLARGARQNSELLAGWSVALRHPLKPEVRLAEFALCNQALGTSGSGTQFFHHQGKRYGHIIDPRTGWPADEVLSATVIAPTAEQADALSTAFYILGIEPAQRFCQTHPEISAVLCTVSKSPGGIELHAINLPNNRWRRL